MANMAARSSISSFCRIVQQRQSLITATVPRAAGCLRLQKRFQSNEAMPAPHIEGTEKAYPAHISSIVDQISKLTLLEVADLNELLKKTLKISDAPMMAMGAAPAPASAEEEEDEGPKKQEQTLFTVKLTKFDEKKKVALIKAIKGLISGMNLVQAKKFVESAPAEVKKDISKDEAEALKKALEEVGGSAEIE